MRKLAAFTLSRVAGFALVPAGFLFWLLVRSGFKSGHFNVEPDWKS